MLSTWPKGSYAMKTHQQTPRCFTRCPQLDLEKQNTTAVKGSNEMNPGSPSSQILLQGGVKIGGPKMVAFLLVSREPPPRKTKYPQNTRARTHTHTPFWELTPPGEFAPSSPRKRFQAAPSGSLAKAGRFQRPGGRNMGNFFV